MWNSDAGKPVYAIADGTIVYARLVAGSTWGQLVVVEHPDSMCSRYGHLRTMSVVEGQTVKRGDQIGTIGGAEYGLPDHKHLDISPSGILKTNPTYWPGDNLPAVLQHFVDPKKWIEEHRGDVAPPPTGVSMPPYFLPAVGDYAAICILKNSWGQNDERQQLQRVGNLSYVTKNQQWERRSIRSDGIYLEMDTSPGGGEYYTIEGTPWLPLSWSVGSEWLRSETVKFFWKENCQPSRTPYTALSKIRFEALHSSWTSPGGVILSRVIELQWIVNGLVEESYWFAEGLGLVQWKNRAGKHSWITERIPAGQQGNNVREVGCFG